MGNPLSGQQWIATAIVFAALFADSLVGKKHLCGPRIEGHQHQQPVPTEEPDLEKNVKSENGDAIELEKLRQ